jgi:transcriptional regulator with XRE-family HTH domain
MMLGVRLKEIREDKKLSQGDIERISGLKRCYVSRVENGHTVPAVETLEKMARALGVPMYRLFYTGEDITSAPQRRVATATRDVWGSRGRHRRYLDRLALALQKMTPDNRELILTMTHRIAQRSRNRLKATTI